MAASDNEAPPTRGPQHEALAVFLGNWRAEGVSYGSPKQTAENPTATAEPWKSTHTARWHTGKFFLVQNERATTGPNPFDTLSVMGVDADTGKYFARCFENHGFYRRYNLSVSGRVWTFDGEFERARYEFSADGNTQTIVWEWRPHGLWLPLCQRTAVRV